MSLAYSGTCPHCIKENVAMTIRSYHLRNIRDEAIPQDVASVDVFFTCNNCDGPVVVNYQTLAKQKLLPNAMIGDLGNYAKQVSIKNVWPILINRATPKYIPENVQRFLQQGFVNLKAKHYDAAGAMARKALEAALAAHDEDLKKGTLYERINKLKENGVLTESLADWAHNVRLLGNDAVHDLEPADPVDVNQALLLAEYLLIYLFTLPTEIRLAKESAEPPAIKE
jgi:hypothetical protein